MQTGREDFSQKRATLERQAQELAILNHLAEAISSSLEIDDILHSICREMVRVFSARNVGIALLNEHRDGLKVVAFHTEKPDESDVTGLEFSLEGNDASIYVIRTGEPIVVPDAQSNPITRSMHKVMRERGTNCLMVVPLMARGDVIGTIGIPSDSGKIFSPDDVRLAQTIAGQVASAIDNARLHHSVKQARDLAERELEIGRQIQKSFFPHTLPSIDGWNIAAHFQSARQVAGDFYDVFTLQQGKKLGIVLADVCDKGVGAALFMVLFRSLLRANLMQCFSRAGEEAADPGILLASAVAKTNDYISENHAEACMFATVFAMVLEERRDEIVYLNCGHDAPVLTRESGTIERLTPDSAAIGMFPGLSFTCGRMNLSRGESVVAFTDGVTDARSADDSAFGEERLLESLSASASLDQRLSGLKKAIESHISEAVQFDDITWVGIERTA